MKLNPDCLRDTLIYLEENLEMNNGFKVKDLTVSQICNIENLKIYDKSDIVYSLLKLLEIGHIQGDISYGGADSHITTSSIKDITWNGHQFLNTIRPTHIWDATKQGASKLGLTSIHALSTIAMNVATAVTTNPEVIQRIVNSIK